MKGDNNNEWGLTELEKFFAIDYVTTKNATQSYLKNYECNYTTANTEGHKLRKKPEVQAFIEFLITELVNDRIMTAEEVLIGLSDMARGDDTELARHQKIYAKDRAKALELLAKHYLLLTEVQKSTVEQKVIFVDDMGGEV